MRTVDAELLAELTGLVGPGQVSAEAGELTANARDCWPRLLMRERAGEILPRPAAVVWPTTTAEASAVYTWATRRGVAVVPDLIKPGGVFGDAVAVDTFEVAAPWGRLGDTYEGVRAALAVHSDLVLCHASHAYLDGAALYFTFGAAGQGDEVAVRARYDAAWTAGLDAAVQAGATITHHHGVGLVRAPWLAEELGEGGMTLLRRVKGALDPQLVAPAHHRQHARCTGGGMGYAEVDPVAAKAILADCAAGLRKALSGADGPVVTACPTAADRLRAAGLDADDLAGWLAGRLDTENT